MCPRLLTILVATSFAIAACGADADSASTSDTIEIVVSTALLGDVVDEIVGDEAEVTVVMPRNADPHNFQPSAKQVAEIADAEALVVNGGGFEAGLLDAVSSAEDDGVPVFSALEAVEPLEEDDDEHEDHDEDDDHDGHDEHGHGEGVDPHFFTDPSRMIAVTEALTSFLTERFPALAIRDRADAYIDELQALDAEVETMLADIPDGERILVTNHEVLGYFADRYDFEVIGTVIPGGSTGDAVSARDLDALATLLLERNVPAVFGETSSPTDLADALAAEAADDIAVVELHAESLGEPGSDAATYVDMIRTNARRIADALTRGDA